MQGRSGCCGPVFLPSSSSLRARFVIRQTFNRFTATPDFHRPSGLSFEDFRHQVPINVGRVRHGQLNVLLGNGCHVTRIIGTGRFQRRMHFEIQAVFCPAKLVRLIDHVHRRINADS